MGHEFSRNVSLFGEGWAGTSRVASRWRADYGAQAGLRVRW